MPFIWNDEKWRMVEENEEYNSNEFVVVRKLFIESKRKDALHISEDSIRADAEHALYGPTDTVEVINPMKCNGKKPEAYITFSNDWDAYFAMVSINEKKNYKYFKQQFTAIPADTWHQPQSDLCAMSVASNDYKDDSMEPIHKLQQLNIDCLLEIFKYCDLCSLAELSEVCRTFNDILRAHVFPKIKKANFHRHENKPPLRHMTLATVRKIPRCVGPYVVEVNINWTVKANSNRFVQKLSQYIGTNIRKLDIAGIRLTEEMLQQLKPMLGCLHVLKYHFINYSEYAKRDQIDCQKLCPKLIELSLEAKVQLVQSLKPWPTLITLSVNYFIGLKSFYSIIQQNSQLKCLKLRYNRDYWLMPVAKYLPNLEKLHLHRDVPISKGSLMRLSGLNYLAQLSLWSEWCDDDDVNTILLALTDFKILRCLKLNFCNMGKICILPTRLPRIIKIAQQLSQLEVFEFYGFYMDQSTVVEFVQFAQKLTEIRTPDFVKVTEEIIMEIVNARKSTRQSSELKNSNGPLKLFFDKSNLSAAQLYLLQKDAVQQYLKACFN